MVVPMSGWGVGFPGRRMRSVVRLMVEFFEVDNAHEELHYGSCS